MPVFFFTGFINVFPIFMAGHGCSLFMKSMTWTQYSFPFVCFVSSNSHWPVLENPETDTRSWTRLPFLRQESFLCFCFLKTGFSGSRNSLKVKQRYGALIYPANAFFRNFRRLFCLTVNPVTLLFPFLWSFQAGNCLCWMSAALPDALCRKDSSLHEYLENSFNYFLGTYVVSDCAEPLADEIPSHWR